MSHAEKCPVCNGSGKIRTVSGAGTLLYDEPCHGCQGKGWITVEDTISYNLASPFKKRRK